MQRVTLLLITLLAIPLAAHAQYGTIGLYTDARASVCEMDDNGQGVATVYVIHTGAARGKGLDFKINCSQGFTASHMGDQVPYLYTGTALGGISISYGRCIDAPNVAMEVTFEFDGSSSPCAYLEVVGNPGSGVGGPQVAVCTGYGPAEWLVTTVPGGRLYVNPDGSCSCQQLHLPVEASTWGKVKAMYNE